MWWPHPLIRSLNTVPLLRRMADTEDLLVLEPKSHEIVPFCTGRPVRQTYRRANTYINLGGVVDSSSDQIS